MLPRLPRVVAQSTGIPVPNVLPNASITVAWPIATLPPSATTEAGVAVTEPTRAVAGLAVVLAETVIEAEAPVSDVALSEPDQEPAAVAAKFTEPEHSCPTSRIAPVHASCKLTLLGRSLTTNRMGPTGTFPLFFKRNGVVVA